jgi:glyoxylase-like metal-dependent hydrolase (beta-lactamase superfamily II)
MIASLPEHLSHSTAKGLCLGHSVAQYELGSGKNFVYLLLDWELKKAAIVDPQSDLAGVLGDLEAYGFTLDQVLLTHTHFDHIAGLPYLMKSFPDLKVRVGASDLSRLSASAQRDPRIQLLNDGEHFQVGSIQVLALHTPGHSPGEFCFYVPSQKPLDHPYVFTGDTIFIRDCGRTDFEGGSNEAMFDSIQKLKALPPESVFLVGHHYAKECATTLQNELMTSPPFRCQTVQELANLP